MHSPQAIPDHPTQSSGQPLTNAVDAFERFLGQCASASRIPRRMDYSFKFYSGHRRKTQNQYDESGQIRIGITEEGLPWVATPVNSEEPTLGEAVRWPEGKCWLRRFFNPSNMLTFYDPPGFLRRVSQQFGPASTVPTTADSPEPEGHILCYPLPPPRPEGMLYDFRIKKGEVRLLLKRDGTPARMKVVQIYEGAAGLSFGRYALDRQELWVFNADIPHLGISKYHLSLQRQDWNDTLGATLHILTGDAP